MRLQASILFRDQPAFQGDNTQAHCRSRPGKAAYRRLCNAGAYQADKGVLDSMHSLC